jgi:hypothetical protein
MPTLETVDGSPVEVAPLDAVTVNAQFRAAMDDDGPDEQAPPKRAQRADDDKPKRRGRPPRAEQARTVSRPAAVQLDDAQRAKGVEGIAQLAAGLALAAAKATGSPALVADAVTIAGAGEQIADACVQVAKTDARFAAALDKVCASGPYAALISVGLSVGLQLVRNHRPAMTLPGTVHPDEIIQGGNHEQATVPVA